MATLTDVVLAVVITLPPTLTAIAALRSVRQVKKDVTVPPKKNGVRPKSEQIENGTNVGTAVHELREDVYELGRLLGSHVLYHAMEESE